ncbi:MAG: RnfABCDGE type electron transport complex subunit D [Candidatus Omnitrophica bacterium]|nr:RnfABCDGE type electron transport complex subunit D [Candidatus Omnitrophota bacterium]
MSQAQSNTVVLSVSSSPHVRSSESTARIMWSVFVCLIPSGIVSWNVFGISAAAIMLTAVGTAALTEALFCRLQSRPLTVGDGSACLTGLLLAYNLPAQAPLWLAALGAAVAIIFGKAVFGGLGGNIFNPALVGRVFLMASFPSLMTRWPAPPMFGLDAVTAPTPLAILKDSVQQTQIITAAEIIPYTLWDLFLGRRGGCIGEASVAALLAGAAVLLWRGSISWHIPASFIGTVAVVSWCFGGQGLFTGNWPVHVLAGGLTLGAFFMATDYVTAPLTKKGKCIFGVGCGLITAIIRLWGGYPEGVSYAILLMNAAVPLIDRYVVPRRFGGGGR